MGGINMINKRRANIQKLGRQRKAASKSSSVLRHRQSIVDGTISQSTIAAMPLNAQQIRALRSNPQANVKLSKKKQRKVLRDARLEQRDRAAKLGLAVEKEMDLGDDAIEDTTVVESIAMDVTGSGCGTTLGGPVPL